MLIISGIPSAEADNGQLVECPDHTHVWNANQCPGSDQGPFSFPGTGPEDPTTGGGNGLGGILGILKGLL